MSQRVNPEMIILARESRGYTQQELAQKLKLEQFEISRMESGFSPTKADEYINSLSRALHYPKSFFYQTSNVHGMKTYFYRKHKGLPAKDLKQILAVMNIYRIHMERLLAAVDIDFLPLKECTLEDFETPERIAQEIRQYLSLPKGRVDNMTATLERFGIIIIPYNFASRKFSGASFLIQEYGTYLIFINNMPPDRWRFTLAHELAHIIMHQGFPNPHFDDDIESQADRFASEFLMPSMDIAPHLSSISLDTLAGLKLHWKVAMSALLKKSLTLGKITNDQYKQMWRKMSQYRLQEPRELDPPVEKPSLLQEIVDFHFNELRYSPEYLCDKFCIDIQEFYTYYTSPKRHLRLVS